MYVHNYIYVYRYVILPDQYKPRKCEFIVMKFENLNSPLCHSTLRYFIQNFTLLSQSLSLSLTLSPNLSLSLCLSLFFYLSHLDGCEASFPTLCSDTLILWYSERHKIISWETWLTRTSYNVSARNSQSHRRMLDYKTELVSLSKVRFSIFCVILLISVEWVEIYSHEFPWRVRNSTSLTLFRTYAGTVRNGYLYTRSLYLMPNRFNFLDYFSEIQLILLGKSST